MKLTELINNLQNDKEVLGVIKDFGKEIGETITIELEEFQSNNFEIRLLLNCWGIEKEVIETWNFFNEKEFLEYTPVINNERYEELVFQITEYIKDLKERMED